MFRFQGCIMQAILSAVISTAVRNELWKNCPNARMARWLFFD